MTSQPPPYQHPGSLPPRPELPEGVDRPPPPAEGDALPDWPPWAPFAAMLLALVIAVSGATVMTVVAQLAGADVSRSRTPAGVTIGGTALQDVALILAAIVLARATVGAVRPADFGLRRVAFGRAAGLIAAAWAAFIVFSGAYASIFDVTNQDELPPQLGADDSTLNLVLVIVLVCVFAPICEEFFFRGFCFTALRRWMRMLPAAILTGIIFGAIHAGTSEAIFLVPLGFFGFVLCLLYRYSGSLVPCMALHALNNGLALSVAQNFSVAGTVALMLGASTAVVGLALVVADSRRLNAAPVAA